jgi:hypothetical protein
MRWSACDNPKMSEWRYFIETKASRSDPGNPREFLMRLRSGEPYILAEARHFDGTWHRDDRLFQQIMLGKDHDYVEVDEARFTEALAKLGPTGNQSFGRPSEEELARLTSTEKRIADVWKSVPIPPGAADISFPEP